LIKKHEVIIVGAGISGLTAALHASEVVDVAVVSKVHAVRSHSGAAQGGIAAAMGNEEEDRWEWHMYDTVKGGDYLADQDMVEILVREAPAAVLELERMGVPFSRNQEGGIAQRPFGGHTREHGKAPVKRACYASDRTGRVIMNNVYDRCLARDVQIYNEYFAMNLIMDDGKAAGVTCYDIASGETVIFHGKAVILATGGCGRVYRTTSNGFIATGDGFALAQDTGVPLQDMEFIQFHPTGFYGLGVLVTEAARGQGGVLRNNTEEPFMAKYAPTIKDLAPRDMVSRAILTEIEAGRGIGGGNYIHLDLTHIGKERIEENLSEIVNLSRIFMGIEPNEKPIPVAPTCHYMMGGIPTDEEGRVVRNDVVPGLYAVGESACISVHGANRLGCNSLIDLVVFGNRTGKAVGEYAKGVDWPELPLNAETNATRGLQNVLGSDGVERVPAIREDMQILMTEKCSIYRDKVGLEAALNELGILKERYGNLGLVNRGRVHNYELREALELANMLQVSEAILQSALAREESRGAHYRTDHPERDDMVWLKHTLVTKTPEGLALTYKPVAITRFQPKERRY
jgi:succinate dehydrogenase / fumarate reductase flavoprotein subunit